MSIATQTKTYTRLARRLRLRRATSSIEVLVAFTMLTTVLSVSVPLLIRNDRLLAAHRDYRVALDELSNQLDRLTALPSAELPQAMERLAPSAFVATRLPGAELNGQLEPGDLGTHLTLKLSWDEPQRRHAPVALAAWVFAPPPTGGQPTGGDAP